jgi:hypothetical protein
MSQRGLGEDDIPRVSRQISSGWRNVGHSLRFTHAQIEAIESDCGNNPEAGAERMLFRWMLWRCEKATVKRLSKALFINGEYGAISAIVP